MFLGIEIGGTKLQLGVSDATSEKLVALERREVDSKRGAEGILESIEKVGLELARRHRIERMGFGFGGPVDAHRGKVIKSHQVHGWEGAPISSWAKDRFQVPVALGNDCDVAALAEAHLGAGRGAGSVFYMTVGTGVGGGFVHHGQLHGVSRPAASEIGHMRPGLHEDRPELTVESLASGPGIVASAQARISGEISRSLAVMRRAGLTPSTTKKGLVEAIESDDEHRSDLLLRCEGDPERLNGKIVAEAALNGNQIAQDVLEHACQVLGWALSQMITLLAPEVVVIGGGVSLIGEKYFFSPIRREVARYVFPPLLGSYRIVPAGLGELAVVHGALLLAKNVAE